MRTIPPNKLGDIISARYLPMRIQEELYFNLVNIKNFYQLFTYMLSYYSKLSINPFVKKILFINSFLFLYV